MSYGELNSGTDGNFDPSSALADPRGNRYPNPFFDLAQQYMPQTIKELFRWCTFYYYSSPIIGAAIKKISRYPITDLIFEDEHETVRDLWQTVLVDHLRLKDRLMEINLDFHTYGNAFVSLHKPFTRFLKCKKCGYNAPIKNWNWNYRFNGYAFEGVCKGCDGRVECSVKDVPYKDIKGLRLIRWNPENINIKHNEYTGRSVYMYTVPYKLRMAIQRGDKDIIEDIPQIVLEAVRLRRMIKFNHENMKHLKAPTLAEQDQGWGKPIILHVLRDMFYFYTLRRAQEAIAQEHILPFDMIYPMPNAQMDPYVHTDLGNWRSQIQDQIRRHRSDPNYKAVIPVPVGTARVGGDGKALMLNPEMSYLTQTISGGLGYPSEMLFGGGLNFTGSSISLRMLENDFIQNRSQMLDLAHWIKDDIRIWMGYPNVERLRFADFRMADDVQRNQQLIGMNAQGKVSDQTMLTELGYDYDQEIKKKIEEIYIANYLGDLQAKGAAKTQGEAQIISTNYQEKIQELAAQAQQNLQAKGLIPTAPDPNAPQGSDPNAQQPQGDPNAQAQAQAPLALPPGEPQPSGGGDQSEFQAPGAAAASGQAASAPNAPGADQAGQIAAFVDKWAKQLLKLSPQEARLAIVDLKKQMLPVGQKVEQAYMQLTAAQGGATGAVSTEPNMNPLPEKGAPMRGEVTGGGTLNRG